MSATMIFVNLPVKDLDASKAFWGKLGYSFNAQFTDENCASMVISDTIVAMLLTEARFKDFTHKAITDTSTSTEALLCLSSESRTAVDELVDAAGGRGAPAPRPPPPARPPDGPPRPGPR
ncbi:VOC family protein, partial [Streptomyces goshikiensis]|uniref:VOC family protein n=1 Tax=Streptomyces goshikiensis TaxID=1942 RepID=UPI0036B3C891